MAQQASNDNGALGKLRDRKIALGVLALFFCVVVIGVSSFFPFIIDPTQWQTTQFMSNEIILTAITVYSMVATIYIGMASNSANAKSQIAHARVDFSESRVRILDLNRFSQWVRQVLQPGDAQSARERELANVGIEDFTVLNLERPEIKAMLDKPQKYGDRFYKGLSQRQIDKILAIKDGKAAIRFVDPSYYLFEKTYASKKTISEQSGKEDEKKTELMSYSIISKSLVSIAWAMVIGSLIYDLTSGLSDAQKWMNLVSRMSAMLSSGFMGYLVGGQANDIEAGYLNLKVIVHKKFLGDVSFKGLAQQEEAKKEFAERVARESVLKLEGGKKDGNE